MPNIIVDPVLVTTPSADATKAEVEAWLNNLELWLNEALTAPFIWLHVLEVSQLLEAQGQFPSFEHLRKLSQKYYLNMNISQIANKINKFFREETFDLRNCLNHLEYVIETEANSIVVSPKQFLDHLPEYTCNSLCHLLAECCAVRQMNYPFGQKLYIATLALADGSREITVSVVILDALPDLDRQDDNKITQALPLLITPDDLLPFVDIFDLWSKGENSIIYDINQQYKRSWPDTLAHPFVLGPRFVESVNKRGLDTNKIVLQSIIRATCDIIVDKVKERHGSHLHPLRKSKTADSPQLLRESDQAKAWRLMIQKHGAGWRLHYWQIDTPEGRMIEFANICKESEEEIY